MQKFVAVQASIHNHLNKKHVLHSRQNFRASRAAALAEWRNLLAAWQVARVGKLRLVCVCLTPPPIAHLQLISASRIGRILSLYSGVIAEKPSTMFSVMVPEMALSGRFLSEADDCADLVFGFKSLLFNGKMWRTFWRFVIPARVAGATGIELMRRSLISKSFACISFSRLARASAQIDSRSRYAAPRLGFIPS
ncbi:MAG: hypothetical protein ACOH2H_24705 [Cypionkella sp.]